MDKTERKAELRRELLDRRSSLTAEEYRDGSGQVRDRLIDHPFFQHAETVHCYLSMPERKEVDTSLIVQKILQEGKRLVVPVINVSPPGLSHIEPESIETLKPNRWGVLEPTVGSAVNPEELDLVIVPMVGGDVQLNRIGYGKGFYDRFLKEIDCPAVGLCFDACMVEEIPVEEFDIKMDKIFTPSGVIG